MIASILDLRRRMRDVLRALERNEPVTILFRGKKRGVIQPARAGRRSVRSAASHPAFGMWRDRKDLRSVEAAVRALRAPRAHDL